MARAVPVSPLKPGSGTAEEGASDPPRPEVPVSATQELSTSVDELQEVRAPRLMPWTGWTLRS